MLKYVLWTNYDGDGEPIKLSRATHCLTKIVGERELILEHSYNSSHEKATKHLANEFDELKDLEEDSVNLCVFNNLAFDSRRTTFQKIFKTFSF